MSEQVTLVPGDDLATGEFDDLAPRLLALVRGVANELRPQARLAATLGLDDSLERDYGLDSLARV